MNVWGWLLGLVENIYELTSELFYFLIFVCSKLTLLFSQELSFKSKTELLLTLLLKYLNLGFLFLFKFKQKMKKKIRKKMRFLEEEMRK